ncbi:MAG: undecaprenyl/decaprenyl-phosphate alpha-N-acetylglucosaminyl 1-phosphate transferase [Armatimonadetes bacterium]|nr:undecaprenyl/decaprenyl-phosphate alpha-N-acetylglucosaminyl 1-phosphate transferase [Armatimonadota bacterium]
MGSSSQIFYLLAAAGTALLAAAISWLVTPWARSLAIRFGAAHAPRLRDLHREPVPRWGGLSVFTAFILSLAVAALAVHLYGRPFFTSSLSQGLGLLLGGTLLTVLGAWDDRREISAGKQLLAQVLCATLAWQLGVRIRWVTHPFVSGHSFDIGWLSYPVTVLWLVGVTNAVNWIDGIDGLAAGVSGIAALTLTLMAVRAQQPGLVLVAAALFGSLMGFLRYNFNPARIFLGGGALFVGFMLAGVATTGAFKRAATMAIAAPLLILGLPLLDTVVVIFRRWRGGRPIYQADRSHLHHRLLAAGYSQRQTVLILYGISLCLSLIAFGAYLALVPAR